MLTRKRLVQQQSNIGLAVGVAVVGLGSYSLYKYWTSTSHSTSNSAIDSNALKPPMTFARGPVLRSLKLHEVETINHNTKRFRFELPQKDAVSGLSLTSAVVTLSKPAGSWLPAPRPYTPISDLNEPGFIDLLIKHYPNGKASSHIHSLNPGQSLFFITAVKGYAWTPNKHPHISLIAGGAGITPIYQLIRGILANPEDKTSMTLVFGVNSDEDVLFENEFAKYEKDYPGRFKVVYTVSNPAEGSVYHKGYVSKELLKEHIMGPEEENTKVFVCGPPAMEKSILGKGGILGQLGYTKSQIYKF